MSKITLKDISKALSVSISTVSKALSDSHEISEATKKSVHEYALKHNFSINKIAQSLKIGKTNTIGVIACAINNNFISQVLNGIQQASLETNYDIIIMQSLEDVGIEKSCIDVLSMRGIDGLLIAPVSENSNLAYLQYLQESNIPVIIFDRIHNKLDTFKIGIKNYEGAYQATLHLIEQGKRNILHITGTQLGVAKERFNGFKSALNAHQIPFDPHHYIQCNLQDTAILDETIKNALKKAFEQEVKPDAIFGATDVITVRTLGVLAELGIRVPEEIAVIGFANTPIAFALNPALSTITQPASEIGHLAMSKLVNMIKSKSPITEFETIQLDTTLEIRKSSINKQSSF